MYIKHNSLGDDIPIVVVLKAMGLECDEEIVQLVGTEPEIVDLFSGSLEEPYYLGIYSQDQVQASGAVRACSLSAILMSVRITSLALLHQRENLLANMPPTSLAASKLLKRRSHILSILHPPGLGIHRQQGASGESQQHQHKGLLQEE